MILLKKAVRSMWDNKKAYVACIVLMAIGIFVLQITGIASEVFFTAKDDYYRDYRLGDAFAAVGAIPQSGIEDVKRIPGIADAAGKYVYDARVILEDTDKIITLRLISIDPSYPGVPLNAVMVTEGELPAAGDIMMAQSFLEAHKLTIGDAIEVIVEGKPVKLNICAVAASPEYVYAVKDATEFLPDATAFSYGYVTQDSLWAFTGKGGLYNDVSAELEKGVNYDEVKTALEDRLAPYGLIALYPQKDHVSVSMVDAELDGISTMSTSIPMIFMIMSATVLYLMLKRVIEQDRSQIGTMKAFGYSNSAILFHYMTYGAVTGLAGGILGTLLGISASGAYINVFKEYFNLPTAGTAYPISLLPRGIIVSLATGLLGSYFGAGAALRLTPAEAMRPPAPKAPKSDILKNLSFINIFLNSGGQMAIRSISRSKGRSLVIVLGIMFSFGIIAFTGSYNTMIDFMMINQYSKVQLFDAKLVLKMPVQYTSAVEAAYKLEGVDLAEGLLEIPAQLKNKNLAANVVLTGIPQGSNLYKIYDNELEASLPPPKDGVIINDGLAKKLKAKKGDYLYISTNLSDKDIKIYITEVVEQNLGLSCYMEKSSLEKLWNIGDTATAIMVKTEDTAFLNSVLDESGNLSAVVDKAKTLELYSSFMGSYAAMFYIMYGLGIVVAFAIIYNTSTISLSERKREYATLRVMGLSVKEVGAIIGFEYWLLCGAGIILGIPYTMLLKEGMAGVYQVDAFTFPTYTPPSAYVIGAIGCIAAVLMANISSNRQIKKFDMVEVLKERE